MIGMVVVVGDLGGGCSVYTYGYCIVRVFMYTIDAHPTTRAHHHDRSGAVCKAANTRAYTYTTTDATCRPYANDVARPLPSS